MIVGGRYETIAPLGQGGVGEVWNAVDRTTGRAVAVKLLRQMHSSNVKLAERFARESRMLARVQSPHVCRVLDSGIDETGSAYLVMERIEGTPLDVKTRGGKALPWSEVQAIFDDVLVGLSAVHAAAIVHRDLKPPNVMVDAAGRARLIDFGISKLVSGAEVPLTSTYATLGTPHYMAPEQLDTAASVDFRADVYAAGTMLYRLLTGKLPFESNNPAQLLVLKRRFDAPSLSDRTGNEWPVALEDFIARMLALAPDDRYPDASAALAAFRETCRALHDFRGPVAMGSGASGVASDAETPVLSRRRRPT